MSWGWPDRGIASPGFDIGVSVLLKCYREVSREKLSREIYNRSLRVKNRVSDMQIQTGIRRVTTASQLISQTVLDVTDVSCNAGPSSTFHRTVRSFNGINVSMFVLFVLGLTSLWNIWGHIATLPACISDTLTNVLTHSYSQHTGMPCRRHRTWHPTPSQGTETGPTCRFAIHWCGTLHWNKQLPILYSDVPVQQSVRFWKYLIAYFVKWLTSQKNEVINTLT